VEDIAVLAVVLLQPFVDDTDDDVIRDQLSVVHIGLGLQPDRRAILDRSAQDVAGGNGRNSELLIQNRSLGAFARAWRTQHDQIHHFYHTLLLKETFVLTGQHLVFQRLDGLQRNTDNDDDGGAADGQALYAD